MTADHKAALHLANVIDTEKYHDPDELNLASAYIELRELAKAQKLALENTSAYIKYEIDQVDSAFTLALRAAIGEE